MNDILGLSQRFKLNPDQVGLLPSIHKYADRSGKRRGSMLDQNPSPPIVAEKKRKDRPKWNPRPRPSNKPRGGPVKPKPDGGPIKTRPPVTPNQKPDGGPVSYPGNKGGKGGSPPIVFKPKLSTSVSAEEALGVKKKKGGY